MKCTKLTTIKQQATNTTMNCEKCFYMDDGKKVYYTCYCEEDKKQVEADNARARSEGYVEVNGRWIKKRVCANSFCERCKEITETYVDECYEILVCKKCNCTKDNEQENEEVKMCEQCGCTLNEDDNDENGVYYIYCEFCDQEMLDYESSTEYARTKPCECGCGLLGGTCVEQTEKNAKMWEE